MITTKQKDIYMQNRMKGRTLLASSAKADFSERTARRINKNEHQKGKLENWRTRKDLREKVWESEIVPLLEKGLYQVT